ncbi:MAG: NUDIX domain-containing protein, partial [Primorskyibacter sp.]
THPHWGEDPLHCAERRLTEELGLTGIPLLFRDQVEYRADVGGGMIEHEVVDIYLGQVAQPVMPQPNPDEVCDTAWVEMADLVQDVRAQPERYTPWLRIYLERHAQVIFA